MYCHFACSYCGKSTVLEIYAETIWRYKTRPRYETVKMVPSAVALQDGLNSPFNILEKHTAIELGSLSTPWV